MIEQNHEIMQQLPPLDLGRLLPLLPLKNVILLPKSIRPIIVGRSASIYAVEHALKHDRMLFITAQRSSEIEHPAVPDMFEVGTRAIISQVMRMPDNTVKVIVEGICRSRLIRTELIDGFANAYCQDIPTTSLEKTTEIEASWRHLKDLYGMYTKLNDRVPADLPASAKNIFEIDYIADNVAMHLDLSFDERQAVLEIPDLHDRILKLCTLIVKEMEILQVAQKIKGHVQTQVDKNQREFYLTEQLKAIQKELGRDDVQSEVTQIKEKIKGLQLSPEALDKVEKELRRLETMPPLSSEAVVSRHYIDWIVALPWSKVSEDRISLEKAQEILNENHAGLAKAKERIIEFLAAKKFSKNGTSKAPIICLVGPPGVGKTSLAQSIAHSLAREFVRISLGGVRDEAEIRGHRRTYIGALPGKIIQAMRKASTQNPVILLDEIDKMTNDVHGDPAAALLEVLDPEQNKAFVDHFLDLEYDLSKVMFIATANMFEGIPFPLLDRMEIIYLSGYTEEEKITIAQKFLIPKNLKDLSLSAEQFVFPELLLRKIITEYTKESGVRQMERIITKLMRKTIQLLLAESPPLSVEITEQLIKDWLGSAKFKPTTLAPDQERIGLATGLAWTEFGGDVLEIETSIVPGKGAVTLTGQLGEVMQESAQAALSYVRSRTKDLGLSSSFHSNRDIHIHMPEGATPKDGPSAGITMCAALISALTKNPVKKNLAMTGEVTLRGRVIGVGGLKEKLLAARQHGIATIVVPKENDDDIQEILKETNLDLNLIYATTMDDVLKVVLVEDPFNRPAQQKPKRVRRKMKKRKKKKKSAQKKKK